jgi:hypothetical protein
LGKLRKNAYAIGSTAVTSIRNHSNNPGRTVSADILQVLLICDNQEDIAATVGDHIDALAKYSRHRILKVCAARDLPAAIELDRFDIIVVHYSIFGTLLSLPEQTIERLRATQALKVVYVQDEHRNVRARLEALRAIDTGVLFTCVPTDKISTIYGEAALPGVLKLNTLTGYVDTDLLYSKVPSWSARPVDVGYRGRRPPIWLGRLGQEKVAIALRFSDDSKRYGLKCDISVDEEDRLYGSAWLHFIQNCKAVLGTESGASCIDFDGAIQRAVEEHLRRDSTVAEEYLYELYVAATDGTVAMNQISPRCFEAAALRTVMILYPGSYSGILVPWRHYIPLEKDHSNMQNVVEILLDESRCRQIIDCVYEEVACNPQYSFKRVAEQLDAAIDDSIQHEHRRTKEPYTSERFAAHAKPSFSEMQFRSVRWMRQKSVHVLFGTLLKEIAPEKRRACKNAIRRWLG